MEFRAPKVFTNPVHFLAFGFGSGLSPKAPGTMGTLVAIPLYLVILEVSSTLYLYLGIIAAAFLLGIYLCGKTAKDLGVHDHGGIVWDEFVGYWITMILVPASWIWIVAGFIAFRFFDITKPFPINWFDKKVSGGFGIMIDDVIAGIYAALVLQVALVFIGT